jgi:uncharacterized membrane protein YjfL (UPF0719 family)
VERLQEIGWGLLSLWVFGVSGIALLYLGYWVFDRLTPRVHFSREIVEKENKAVALVIASVLIGVALIVAATMRGG